MKPIYPSIIKKSLIQNGNWTDSADHSELVLHIKNVCADFPSIILGYSAHFDSKAYSNLIAEKITEWGINVFMPDFAVPLSAISHAIITRNMQLALYVEEASDSEIRLITISTHGGLFDEQDLQTKFPSSREKKGVIGSTDVLSSYVKHLSGFADPFIENGLSLKNIEIPFPELVDLLKNNEQLQILFENDINGLSAKINENGCLLRLEDNGRNLTTEDIALRIANYLKKERFTTGSIIVPKGNTESFQLIDETIEVEGNEFDLSYQAGFSDLFLGWWPDGLIALQGSSCFGDGILSAIYYIESLRTM